MSKIGLIIGSFDPIHLGHINMIKYGAQKCERLNVLVCATAPTDSIDGKLRFKWVKEIFKDYKNINVELLEKKMPDSKKSSYEVSKVWAKLLKEMYQDVNLIIASELYGEYLAELMSTPENKVNCDIYDFIRVLTPISSTAIRSNPYKNWKYIPDIVKPYYISKVCIYGPESTGKSTLTKNLATYYSTNFVEEAARKIIDEKRLKLDHLKVEDLEDFAEAQYKDVLEKAKYSNKYLFCDTDNLTTQIYSDVYFNEVTEKIKKYDSIHYDLYILMDVDVNWVEDAQRNLGNRRKEMFERFKNELDKRNIEYIVVNGNWHERFQKSITAITDRFENNLAKALL